MDRLIEILEDIAPEVDFENCTDLIDGHRIDSLAIIAMVAEIEEEFDVVIPTVELVPENFNSAQKIYELIVRLEEEG